MTKFKEYPDYDALGLAALVKQGDVSPADILESALSLVEELNPRLNAVIRLMQSEAQRDVESRLSPGPFEGVPILLKDEYISYAGVPNDQSSRLAAGLTRPYDTFLVQAYKSAGMMIIGKTNLPEFGAGPTTDSKLYGACCNPWNLEYNSGGSSGGSACAVAAGMVPVAYSNDGGGSIRIPASCCGVFGLKPTRGRVSTAPDGGEYWNGLVIEHAITRSVRDSAALLDSTDSPQPGDYYSAPKKARPFLTEVNTEPPPLRIALSIKPPSDVPVAPECQQAAQYAARLCETLGHHVEEANLEFDGERIFAAMKALLSIHLALGLRELEHDTGRPANPETVERVALALANEGKRYNATEFLGILELFTYTARQLAPFWNDYDVLLTPTLGTPPVKNGYLYTDDPDLDRYIERKNGFIPFTPIANVLGNPAMTVPLYWNADNLPIGSHFIGRFGDEATLFQLAGQLERAHPWAARRAPVSAWNQRNQALIVKLDMRT